MDVAQCKDSAFNPHYLKTVGEKRQRYRHRQRQRQKGEKRRGNGKGGEERKEKN